MNISKSETSCIERAELLLVDRMHSMQLGNIEEFSFPSQNTFFLIQPFVNIPFDIARNSSYSIAYPIVDCGLKFAVSML